MLSQYNWHKKSRKRDKRLMRKEKNFSLFSVFMEKLPQRTYQNAIITNRLQDSKSVYKNQLYFFQGKIGN